MIIDFHSHILPGVDDGSNSVEESLQMLRLAREQGIECMVATPHFYADTDTPDRFLERRQAAYEALMAAVQEPIPQIRLGAEVHYFPGISESEQLRKLTIEGGTHLLLEMPRSPWSRHMYQEIGSIRVNQGITPIMAHVDRYFRLFNTYGIPQELEKLPVLVQANTSFFRRTLTRSMAMGMLQKGQIHLLGSDCHNMTSRLPNLRQTVDTIKAAAGEEMLSRIEGYQREVFPE